MKIILDEKESKVYLDNMENLTDRKADYDKLSN